MKRAGRSILLLLCAMAAFAARGASMDAPQEAGMRHVGNSVYVDPEMSRDQIEQAHKLLEKARKRVGIFYGDLIARPKIVFCASADCYREFGAVGLGFSDGNNLVVSPHGQRVAIIAHELAHVEFSARVGGFAKVLERVPQWFDEGQAVMVSMAEEFSEEAWMNATEDGQRAPDLHSLASMDDWTRLTGASGENMQLTYGTAKQEVNRWFVHSGHRGFQALLKALRENESFADAYSRIEAHHGHVAASSAGGHYPAAAVAAEPESSPAGSYFMRAAW